jgi:hypothetical protein
MRGLRQRWERFWFEPTSPTNLGVCRMLFFGALFLFYWSEDFSAWAEVSPVFWRPIGLFRRLHLPLFPRESMAVIGAVWKGTLVLSSVGLCTRLSTGTAFLFGVYLLGLPHNFGKIHHFDAVLVFVLGVMALSRCGDGWSVDRLLRTALSTDGPVAKNPLLSGEYTWPVRTVWLILALIFFAAGASKLRHSGLEWVFSDYLQILLIQYNYHLANADPLTSWGPAVAQHSRLTRLLAGATIGIEVGYPLALFSRSARWLLVPGGVLSLLGIRVLMGPTFEPLMLCSLFWVPWDRVGLHFTRPAGLGCRLV